MHPILFSTPWFNVYSYGLMIAVGYSLATAWTVYQTQQEGLPGEAVFDMLLIQMVVGILGSRALYLAEHGGLTDGFRFFLDFERGGLTIYGAIISGIVFDVLYLKWRNLPFWQVMDALGAGVMLGGSVGRIGCFLNGCCFGHPCSYPWGVVFPKVGAIPLHPTQIYESLALLAIFLLLQKVKSWRRSYGQVFLASMLMYAAFRFCVEFWRGDNPAHALDLTLSQWVALGMLTAGVICWKALDRVPALRILPKVASAPDHPVS